MEQFFGIIVLAIVVEGIVTYVKEWFVNNKFHWQQAVTVILGIFVCIAYNLDLIQVLGVTSTIPYVGCVLTGILISRGSNYIFDLISKLQNPKKVEE